MKLVDDALQGTDAQIVHSIHDEVVVECAEGIAEETARRVAQAMTAAGEEFLTAVPVIVDAKVADAWLKE
jgi:DNA polymerase I